MLLLFSYYVLFLLLFILPKYFTLCSLLFILLLCVHALAGIVIRVLAALVLAVVTVMYGPQFYQGRRCNSVTRT